MLQNKKKTWKTIAVTAVGALSISLLAACGSSEESSGGFNNSTEGDTSAVVVKYKGGEITENEFNTELKIMKFMSPDVASLLEMDQFREVLVQQQVTYEYLSNDASKEAAEKGLEEAQTQLEQMKTQVGGEEAWNTMLKEYDLTEDELKNYMARVMTIVQDKSKDVTDEQLKAEFDKNIDQFITASVRHVLINFTDPETNEERPEGEALKIAKEVKAKLDKGEDFATVAKEYSEDPGSAENGGLYEDTPVASWVDAFKEAAKTQELNVIGDPVETEYGYHIIKVEKRTEPKFEELTDEQKETLTNSIVNTQIQDFMTNDLEGIMEGEITLPANPAAEEGTDGTEGTGTGTEGTEEGTTGDDSAADESKTDNSTTDEGTATDGTTTESGTDGK